MEARCCPGFDALPLSVLLPTKSHPSSPNPSAVSDGPCILGFSPNINATPFLRANTTTQRRKHFLSFASPMTRPVLPTKIAETAVSRRCHQTSTQSHAQLAPRRAPEIGDHGTPERDWTAVASLHLTQRPLPAPPSIINEGKHREILRRKKRKMTTSFTPSNQPCRTLGRPS